MFEKQYSTRKIAEEIGTDLKMIMWSMIEKWKNENVKVDYLQVYELSIEFACGQVYQKIRHSQEISKKTEILYFKNVDCPVNAKIFIIDEDGNGVMMFSHEY